MATSRLSTRRVEWRVQVGTSNKPAQGLIIFEASVSYIPDPLAAGGPRTAIPEPVAAVLDASGYACTPAAGNPSAPGERSVELFTTDSLGEDGGDWTWTARPQLRSVNGIQMTDAVPAFSFAVPAGTGNLDLATVQKVPASPGLGTERAVTLTADAQRAATSAAADAKTAVEIALVATGPVDAAVDAGIERADLSGQVASQIAGTKAQTAALVRLESVNTQTKAQEHSAYYANFATGTYLLDGVNTTPALAAPPNHSAGNPIIVHPAYTNLLPQAKNGALGTVGAGGSYPDDWPVNTASVTKTVLKLPGNGLTVKMGPTKDTYFGGFSTVPITAPSPVMVVFDAEISNIPTARDVVVEMGWAPSSGSGLESPVSLLYASDIGVRKFSVHLEPPATGVGRLQFRIRGWTSTAAADVEPILAIGQLSVHPASATGTDPVMQPPYNLGAQPARDATLPIPPGAYEIIFRTDYGWLPAHAIVGSGGLVLSSILKAGRVTELYAFASGTYSPAIGDMLMGTRKDGFLGWTTGSRAINSAVLKEPLRTADGPQFRMPSKLPRAAQVSASRPGLTRFDVRKGDFAEQDTAANNRSEFKSGATMPFDTDIWVSDQFRILEYGYTGQEQYALLHQLLHTTNPGQPGGLGPDYSLVASPTSTDLLRLRIVTRSTLDPNATSNPPGSGGAASPMSPVTLLPWETTVEFNTWHHVVSRIRFSQKGGGHLTSWLNGVRLFTGDIPVGVNKGYGPKFGFGLYRNADSVRTVVDHANVEFGTTDLMGRVSRPLPI